MFFVCLFVLNAQFNYFFFISLTLLKMKYHSNGSPPEEWVMQSSIILNFNSQHLTNRNAGGGDPELLKTQNSSSDSMRSSEQWNGAKNTGTIEKLIQATTRNCWFMKPQRPHLCIKQDPLNQKWQVELDKNGEYSSPWNSSCLPKILLSPSA